VEFQRKEHDGGKPYTEVIKSEWLKLWKEEAEFQWNMSMKLGTSVLIGKKFYKPKKEG
jgi:hypothetical protein